MSNVYSTQNDLVFNVLKQYYCDNDYHNLNKILPIINGHDNISLRLIDWFVTNYSKQHFTGFLVNDQRFVVHTEYKLKLRSYKKKRFDPFCRWERIILPYENDKYIQTTIGQLNFFKWANENNIIDYIKENKDEIEDDMNKRNKNSEKKKRNELSIAAVKTIKKESVEITVTFS
jgi:hypothetical protein